MSKALDPLPSWHDSPVKERILDFINKVTDESSPYFVPPEERIATFDNDGTLWVEKPVLAQLAFYKKMLLGADVLADASKSKRMLNWLWTAFKEMGDLLKLLKSYVHVGITTDEYRQHVAEWIEHAKHPRYEEKYTALVYQPMMEVMALFAKHEFSNYIVSGGTANFIRPWSESVYNVSSDRIIASSVKTRLSKKQGELVVKLEPLPFSFEYRAGKVLGIERRLAKRPIAAFGNSLGDVDMLRWARTTHESLCVLIHHTDGEREYKYSPDPFYHFGKKTLTWAKESDWQVVDMKEHWKTIFSFEEADG